MIANTADYSTKNSIARVLSLIEMLQASHSGISRQELCEGLQREFRGIPDTRVMRDLRILRTLNLARQVPGQDRWVWNWTRKANLVKAMVACAGTEPKVTKEYSLSDEVEWVVGLGFVE